jgi:hypothetical protein
MGLRNISTIALTTTAQMKSMLTGFAQAAEGWMGVEESVTVVPHLFISNINVVAHF